MKLLNKFLELFNSLINLITMLFFSVLILFGLYAFYDSFHIVNGAKLPQEILTLRPNKKEEKSFSLAELQNINKDICGWITIDNTSIDYPLVIGKNNLEYLSLDYTRKYSTAGSIFMDYRNSNDFTDNYNIIYGHNMKQGYMFSDIKKFIDLSFFNNHLTGTLYAVQGIYNIDIIYVARVNAFSNEIYNPILYKETKIDELINYFELNAIHKNNTWIEPDAKLMLLSTCDVAGSSDRLVLLTKITLK